MQRMEDMQNMLSGENPIKEKPKNVVDEITFGHNDEESGERVIDAYVYERYV